MTGQRRKSEKRTEPEEDLYDDDDYYDDDEGVSKLPIIILGVAIVIVAGIIAYMLLK